FVNDLGKDRKYEMGVNLLEVILSELELKNDRTECFILFHLRDLGKFRIKEAKLHQELMSLWGQYKDYKLNNADFSHSLKNLMRTKVVIYRRGSISLNPIVRVRLQEV
ncbi:hypothetical protein OAB57_02900, partial [Bacteriovoracaceae bacterium]|nr:hypothetical protein [Bacteriovoracaceae bacterium]